jgi:phosphatidylserine decarboxylase
MAKEAYPFLIPLALLAFLFFEFGLPIWSGLFLALGIFVACFFRDPERSVPVDVEAIVSPADGKVVRVSTGIDGMTEISIFLSVFNVHINRSPIGGRIESICHRPGKFRVAFDERASVENEQNVWTVQNGSRRVKFSQIAGILARRIVSWKRMGDRVEKGERVGLIKFGSRVDIFLPTEVIATVRVGDKVKGGSSIIGRFNHA